MSSELDRIANLLLEQIRSRQTLAIGTAQATAIQGTRALYQTPNGIISAIATNFCYGDCLLAKVEGTWYAVNPVDNRAVVRSSVDRLIRRKNLLVEDLPIVLIEFAPGSPTSLAPGAGNFVVRIKIDRPEIDDLRVKLELSGTASSSNYTVVGLDGSSPTVPIVIIPAGVNFVDITITPTSSVNSTKTIIVTALQLPEYQIGQDKSVTATIAIALRKFSIFRRFNVYNIDQFDNTIFIFQGNETETIISIPDNVDAVNYSNEKWIEATSLYPFINLSQTPNPADNGYNISANPSISTSYVNRFGRREITNDTINILRRSAISI